MATTFTTAGVQANQLAGAPTLRTQGLGAVPFTDPTKIARQEATADRANKVLDAAGRGFDKFLPERPDDVRQIAINSGFIRSIPGYASGDYNIARDSYARQNFGGIGVGDDKAFFRQVQALAKHRDDAADLQEDLMGSALKKGFGDVTRTWSDGFSEWKQGVREMPGYDPKKDLDYQWAYNEVRRDAGLRVKKFQPELEAFAEAAIGDKIGTVDEAFKIYESLAPEDRQEFLYAMKSFASMFGEEAETDNLWTNLVKATSQLQLLEGAKFGGSMIGTGSFQTQPGMAPTMRRDSPLLGTQEEVDEARRETMEKRQFVRAVTQVAHSNFDPIKQKFTSGFLGSVESGVYQVPQVVSYAALSSIPFIGQAFMASSMVDEAFGSTYENLVQQGVPHEAAIDFAGTSAPLLAAPMYALERLQVGAIWGKVPWVKDLLGKVTGKIRNRAMRGLVGGTVIGAGETATEIAQQAVPYAGQQLAAILPDAIKTSYLEEIPGVDVEAMVKELEEMPVSTFVSMIPLMAFGAYKNVNWEKQVDAFVGDMRHNPTRYRAAGYSPDVQERAAAMVAAGDRKGAAELLTGEKAFDSQDADEARTKLIEQQERAAERFEMMKQGGVVPRVVATSNGWEVYHPQTDELILETEDESKVISALGENIRGFDANDGETAAHYAGVLLAMREVERRTEGAENVEMDQGFSPGEDVDLDSLNGTDNDAAYLRSLGLDESGESEIGKFILGYNRTEFRKGVAEVQTRLAQGATLGTVFHEYVHAKRAMLEKSGRWSREDQLEFLRGVDRVMGDRTTRRTNDDGTTTREVLRLVPEDFDQMTPEEQFRVIDEGVSEVMDAEILRTRKTQKGMAKNLEPGLVTKSYAALAALAARNPGSGISKGMGFLRAVRTMFGKALHRSVLIEKGIREGTIDRAEYEAVIERINGIDEQAQFDRDVEEASGSAPETSFSLAHRVDEKKLEGYFSSHDLSPEQQRQAVQETGDLFAWGESRTNPNAGGIPGASPNIDGLREFRDWSQRARNDPSTPPAPAVADSLTEGGAPVSILLDRMLSREIPSWDPVGKTVSNPEDVFALNASFRNPWFETLRLMATNPDGEVVAARVHSVGSIAETIADLGDIVGFLTEARETNPEARLIVSHNHPGGIPGPSAADIRVTKRLDDLLKAAGLPEMVDHVITNGTRGYSFKQGAEFDMPASQEVDWSALERTSMPVVDSPDIAERMGASLRAKNPATNWVVYLDTRLRVRGMNLASSDPADASATMLRDMSKLGTRNVLLFPGSKAGAPWVHQVKRTLDLTGSRKVVDATVFTGGQWQSARATGMLEPGPSFSIGRSTVEPTPETRSEPASSAFQTLSSEIPDALRLGVATRIRDPEQRVDAYSRLYRELARLGRKIRQLELQGKGDQAFRNAEAEREKALEEVTARQTTIRSRFEDVRGRPPEFFQSTKQPLHALLIEAGGVIGKTKAGDADTYEGASGLPRQVFANGTLTPEQAATKAHAEGLIEEATVPALWEALHNEQSTAKFRQAEKKAMNAEIRAVREMRKDVPDPPVVGAQDERRRIREALVAFEALRRALPTKIRSQMGGPVQLATLTTNEARLAFLRDRFDRVDDLLETHLKREANNALDTLLKRSKGQAAPGKKKKSGMPADIHELFGILRQARKENWDSTKARAEVAGYRDALTQGQATLSATQQAALQVGERLITGIADWHLKPASERLDYVAEARELHADALAMARLMNLARKAADKQTREQLRADAGDNGSPADASISKIENKGLRGKMREWLVALISFEQVVERSFGRNSVNGKRMVGSEREAYNAYTDNTRASQDAMATFLRGVFGEKFMAEDLGAEEGVFAHRQADLEDSKRTNGLTVSFTDWQGKTHRLSQMEALTMTMMWMQSDGRRHMEGVVDDNGTVTSDWHYRQEDIDAVENQLTDEARAIRSYLLEQYEREYYRINRVYRMLNGANMPRISNYSPVSVAPQQTQAEVIDPSTGMPMRSGDPGALLTRSTSAIARPEFRDALNAYLGHTQVMEYWMAYAPLMRELKSTVSNREVMAAVENKAGKATSDILSNWVRYLEDGGRRDAAVSTGIDNSARGLVGRTAQVALWGRASVLAIQATQLGAASGVIPMRAYVPRMAGLLSPSGVSKWRSAINSDYVQRRVSDAPPAVRLGLQQIANAKPNRLKYHVRQLGELISGADALFTAATYSIIKDYKSAEARELGMTDEAQINAYASREAERLTDQVAQPTSPSARSFLEVNSKGWAMKAVFAFASEPRQKLGFMIHALTNPEYSKKEKLRAVHLAFMVGGIGASLIRAVMRDIRDDEDDELFDENNWSPKNLVLSSLLDPLGGIPLAGAFIQEAAYDAAGVYQPSGGYFSPGSLPDFWRDDRDLEQTLTDIDRASSFLGKFNDDAAALSALTHLLVDAYRIGANAAGAFD